ncbi:MAG: reverse transcriptase domain-containing protein, partial [Oscillospiraceae bacterium]
LLEFIKFYLARRCQRVLLNGFCSSYLNITSGVPQGSILGPLFFLIYINDLIENIESESFLFADDVSLLAVCDTWEICETKLNNDLNMLYSWSTQWLLTFNTSKSYYMLIYNLSKINNNIHLNLKLNQVNINQVAMHKHLGVVLNESLGWTDHVDHFISGCQKDLAFCIKLEIIYRG